MVTISLKAGGRFEIGGEISATGRFIYIGGGIFRNLEFF
jgi:hypothetical protein